MNEIGLDISKQKSKDLTEDMMRNSDKIINMGCMDKNFCPTLFIPKVAVLATGAVVIDAKFNGILGIPFIAFLPFIGVAVGVYLFGKISMAHFNPAVTLGFLITKHITRLQLLFYFTAEILGALLGSLFVMAVIGREADLGANSPNYAFPLPTIFGIEVLASALLMAGQI